MHRDGVIEASIDHSNSWLLSNEVVDLYSTEEPQKAFHKCVCLIDSQVIDHVKSFFAMFCVVMSFNVMPCEVFFWLTHLIASLSCFVTFPLPSQIYTLFFIYRIDHLCFTTFRRIAFCLDVHNEAVKCMRYPPDAYKKELALGDKDRKDEKSIEELIKELEDEYEE